jgi:F-type H+/Na+-transporting ATPase subunit alpha
MKEFESIFQKIISSGNPVGEVVGVDKFMVKVRGLHPVRVNALIMFEDGSKGFVKQVDEATVSILHLGDTMLVNGMLAVVQHQELVAKVGKDFIGRVISVNGKPLDGKGPIAADATRAVFTPAPPLWSRKLLETQLESGITAVDAIFPVVRGQRIAVIGDSKSGKTTVAAQLAINQKNTDQIVVYCLIAKRRSDVDALLSKLNQTGAIDSAIVVVSTMFDSLVMSYLAPYVAVSMAEYLWQDCDQDTIIIYDDLTAHAHATREIALLSGVSPGRDSYPGDMFYSHSSLLERAGRLDRNGKCLTSIPVVLAANGDITAYLPTNIMSITDGQWILDMDIFRSGIRPAVNMGLSVTRIGGVGHNKRQKRIAATIMKLLAQYRQAEEFSHFGSELSAEAKLALEKGKNILQMLTQGPTDVYSLMSQQLMLDIVLDTKQGDVIDLSKLRQLTSEYAEKVKKDDDYDGVKQQLEKLVVAPVEKSEDKKPTSPAEPEKLEDKKKEAKK